MKTCTIGDILSEDQLAVAMKRFREYKPGTFAKTICAELIEPNIHMINEKTENTNVSMYLAYCVEAALMQHQLTHQEVKEAPLRGVSRSKS